MVSSPWLCVRLDGLAQALFCLEGRRAVALDRRQVALTIELRGQVDAAQQIATAGSDPAMASRVEVHGAEGSSNH
jgi:hypothetical protein